MEIQEYDANIKEFYSSIMEFIDSESYSESELLTLDELFEAHQIFKEKEKSLKLFELISKISDNHHCNSDFLNKIEKILILLFQKSKGLITDNEIIRIFETNKRILLYLFLQNLIIPDKNILDFLMMKKDENGFKYCHYLYPGIKHFLDEDNRNLIEYEIIQQFNENIETFEAKCLTGENDSYICTLIRQDSVEDFIPYINKRNISLTSEIPPSIFETNSLLLSKNPSLIEYAAFFGSIQIVQYLQLNQVELNTSILRYAVHSKNDSLIYLFEKDKDLFDESVFMESIKCHHNDIADYIRDNILISINENEKIESCIINSQNYHFYPDDIGSIISRSKYENGFNIINLSFSKTFSIITIPQSTISIGNNSFSNCSLLVQISIPSSVKSIGNGAFSGCSSLAQISIPSSVTLIGDKAFFECKSLTEMEIPSSVNLIGNYAFNGCSKLIQISIPSSVTQIGCRAFEGCTSLKELMNLSSVTEIKVFTFSKCSFVKKINIPSSVTSISSGSFEKCFSLENIEIPLAVTSIGEWAFEDCSSITRIIIPSSVTSIIRSTFRYCSSLQEVFIPSSVISIGSESFKGCRSLKQITIPSSVTSIGLESFAGCSSLVQITIPSSVTFIGNGAFESCSGLNEISIPSSITFIGRNTFSLCLSLKQIFLPASINAIGEYAFYFCKSLTQIQIPPSVIKIEKFTFSECSSLVQIELPSNLTFIGNNSFESCSSLKQISIPRSVKIIETKAFFRCSSLNQVLYEENLHLPYIDSDAFKECNSLQKSNAQSSVFLTEENDHPQKKKCNIF